MSAQLKPCPFCGSHDIEIKQVIQDSWMIHGHQYHATVNQPKVFNFIFAQSGENGKQIGYVENYYEKDEEDKQ